MVWNVWDRSRGSGVGEKSLGLEWRTYEGCIGPSNSVETKDGYGGPGISVEGFGMVWGA